MDGNWSWNGAEQHSKQNQGSIKFFDFLSPLGWTGAVCGHCQGHRHFAQPRAFTSVEWLQWVPARRVGLRFCHAVCDERWVMNVTSSDQMWWSLCASVMSHELSPTHLITTSPKLGSWELRSLVNFRSKQSKYWASNFDPWLLGILQTAMPDPSFVPRGRSLESRRWSQQSWCGVGAPGGKKTIQNHPKPSKAHRGLSASVEDFGRYSFNFFYIVLSFNYALNIFITGAEDLRFARQNFIRTYLYQERQMVAWCSLGVWFPSGQCRSREKILSCGSQVGGEGNGRRVLLWEGSLVS